MASGKLRVYWWIYAGEIAALSTACLGAAAFAFVVGRPIIAALALAPLLILVAAMVRRALELRAHRHIPGPRPSFFLGNLESLLAHEHGARDQALVELHRKYGPVVRLHLAWGSTPFVSLSRVSPVLSRKDVDSNRRADRMFLGDSLMGLTAGETHQRHRRELGTLFTPSAIRAGLSRVHEASELYLETWRDGLTRHGSLKADLHHWSAHSLGRFLCGDDWPLGADLFVYLDAIAAIEEAISVRSFHPYFAGWHSVARARAGRRKLFDFFAPMIDRRRSGNDALGKLAALDWPRPERVEEMISLVAGGTDAVSYTMAQVLTLLSQNLTVQAEARLEAAVADPGGPPPSFLFDIVRETLRLHPPVPFSSKVVPEGGTVEEGLFIPAGTNLMWMKTAVGRDASVFRHPERFDPSRFSSKRESIADALPFGAGPRHCLAHGLAEVQCATLLQRLLLEFEIVPVRSAGVTFNATVSVTPSSVPVRLERAPRPMALRPVRAAAGCPFGHG